jgi:hypothetical protein
MFASYPGDWGVEAALISRAFDGQSFLFWWREGAVVAGVSRPHEKNQD